MNRYRVLVIGPRRALIDVLRTRGITFAVWREKASFHIADAEQVVTAPLWNTNSKLKQIISESFGSARYTHVIAGTEAAVYPAAVARRILGARVSPVTTALRCRDKLAMKEYLSGFGIPMTDFMAESSAQSPAQAFARLGTPLVRKYRKSSGGRGLELMHREQDLVLRKDGRNILERYVSAPEASIESFIQNARIRFVNTTRYLEKGHVNFVPSAFDDTLLEAIQALNRRVIEALKINWGITHLEVYLTDNGLLFGEIALRPPGGYIMNAMQHAWAFNPWAAMVAMELGERFDFPDTATAYACVEIFHPGAGLVTVVRGGDLVRKHASTREFRLKVQPGDSIGKRESAGQDIGYLLHASDSPAARLALYRHFQKHFVIEVH
ncbi:MAG: ATP-grasp domain-containing protein [Gammaproteobacteria bacterium]